MDHIEAQEPIKGKFHVLTGENGTGKTRYLSKIAESTLTDIVALRSPHSRMICISGTIYDKFPQSEGIGYGTRYIYLGNRTGNNMFSGISPFRKLARFLLADDDTLSRRRTAGRIFQRLGLSTVIRLEFRKGRNAKENPGQKQQDVLDIELDLQHGAVPGFEASIRWQQLISYSVHLSGVVFFKDGVGIALGELSSGERFYVLTVLGLCFCSIDDMLVLIDEPENSMHPKWQVSLIEDVSNIISSLSARSTVVVATHSPLVVASVPNDNGVVLDLSVSKEWVASSAYGKTSDSVLADQFDLVSPRSLAVTLAIQDCLSALLEVDIKPHLFEMAADTLSAMDLSIGADDPLFSTVKEIEKIRGKMR